MKIRRFLLLFSFAVLFVLWPKAVQNITSLLVSRTLSPYLITKPLEQFYAWKLYCLTTNTPLCSSPEADFTILAAQHFSHYDETMHIVTDHLVISASEFIVGGESVSNRRSQNAGVLYGNGFLYVPVFFAANDEVCWLIEVQAIHDFPPPVELEVYLDGEKLSTLIYEKGDQSSETRSFIRSFKPRLHWLSVWFVNDYFNLSTNGDRNAYINEVVITREDKKCEIQ